MIITPADLTDEPINIDKETADIYEKTIVSKTLASNIDVINLGLSFFDLKAKINDIYKNQLDFYNNDDVLLYQKRIEVPKTKIDYVLACSGVQYQTEFKIGDSTFNWYTSLANEKGIEHTCLYLYNGNYTKALDITRKNKKIVGIDVSIQNQEDFINKALSVHQLDGDWLDFKLDDLFGSKGNSKNRIVRHLRYINWLNGEKSAYVKENKNHEKTKSLDMDSSYSNFKRQNRLISWINNNRTEKNISSYQKMLYFNNQIMSHPRSKEIISYLESAIEKEFPGLMKYIKKTFPIYSEITNIRYEEDKTFDRIYRNSVIVPECDFSNIKTTGKKI